jgi:hypothetical protein
MPKLPTKTRDQAVNQMKTNTIKSLVEIYGVPGDQAQRIWDDVILTVVNRMEANISDIKAGVHRHDLRIVMDTNGRLDVMPIGSASRASAADRRLLS